MSEIRYIHDQERKYTDNILKTLQSYNQSQTGKRKTDNYYIYAFRENELVGGLHTEQFWDWAFIGACYFKDFTVLTALLNEMYRYYKGNIVGIQYSSNDDEVVNHLLKCGFVKNGEVLDYPKGKTKYDMLNTNLNLVEMEKEYEFILSNEKIDEHSIIIEDFIKANQKQQVDIQFVALHQDTFAGGVYGYLKNDYLYVSLLIVSNDYRNMGIASKLMDLIEEEALKQGYHHFYLDTCEFQALGFYLKRNYRIAATIKEFPIGFDEYMLVKTQI